jgi:WD40 repeat protein
MLLKITKTNIKQLHEIASFRLPQPKITGVIEWSVGSRMLFVGGNRGIWSVNASDIYAMQPATFHEFPANIHCVAVNPKNINLLACGADDGKIYLWHLDQTQIIATRIGHKRLVADLAFGNNGESLFSLGSWDDRVFVWETIQIRENRQLVLGVNNEFTCLAPSHSGNILVTGDTGSNGVAVWEINKQPHMIFSQDGSEAIVTDITLCHDGKYLASGDISGTIILWDANEWRIQNVGQHEEGVISLSFNNDVTLLASGGLDGNIDIWDLNLRIIKTLPVKGWPISTVSFNRDGTLLVASCEDGTIQLWGIAR